MKKLSLLAILVGFATVFATSLSAPTVYGPTQSETVFSWNVATETPVIPNGAWALTNHTASKKDTLVGIDSIALLNHFPIDKGWFYAIQVRDTTGAADSIHFLLTVYGSDGKTIMQSRAPFDTMGGTQTFDAMALPVNSTVYGSAISLKAFKWIAAKTAKIWRFELIRYKSSVGGFLR